MHGTAASRGVCVIINKNFKGKITEVISDTKGRWLICNLKTKETQFSLVNVYAANMDDPSFFNQLFTQIENKGLENIIIGGFNLVQNILLDKSGNNTDDKVESRKIDQTYMEEKY